MWITTRTVNGTIWGNVVLLSEHSCYKRCFKQKNVKSPFLFIGFVNEKLKTLNTLSQLIECDTIYKIDGNLFEFLYTKKQDKSCIFESMHIHSTNLHNT